MKKIYKWLKKKLKCFNEGHDYRYKEVDRNGGYFICQRCGKVSRTAFWSKEEQLWQETMMRTILMA